MQTHFDVVIVGAGPVGMATACTLKAIHASLQICVLDKRSASKRSHGLSIQADAIEKISQVLDQSKECDRLKEIYASWKSRFIRTNEIEISLQEEAKRMGISVLRGSDYEINDGDLKKVLENPSDQLEKQKLQSIFKNARVVIAADGSHSIMRKELGITLAEDETLKYLVELKYQTKGMTEPRGYKEASYVSSKTGLVGAEIMNRQIDEDKKPATYLLFIDKPTYESLREKDAQGNLKGVYGNSWTLQELSEKNKKVYDSFQTYIRSVTARGGICEDAKVSTLEMRIYRSHESVKNVAGKQFLLVGDANSGLVLQRGFNKGLKEAAFCAKAVSTFFNDFSNSERLNEYQNEAQSLFAEEQQNIYLKIFGISAAQSLVSSAASSFDLIDKSPSTIPEKFSLSNWKWSFPSFWPFGSSESSRENASESSTINQ
jgi:flavin-dependent dehydrogenase